MRAALVSVAILAACVPARDPGPGAAWTIDEAPGRMTLAASDADGPALAMTCLTASRQLVVWAPRLEHVAGERRFSFGTADHAVTLAAAPGPEGAGVAARGPVPEPVLNSMLSGAAILGRYGGQALGPLTAPLDLAGEFAGTCIAPSPARMRDIGLDSASPRARDGSTVIQAGRAGASAE